LVSLTEQRAHSGLGVHVRCLYRTYTTNHLGVTMVHAILYLN
jgi:hypothetical protein